MTAAATDVSGRPLALRDVDLDRFFRPRTVAVVGASDTPGGSATAMWRKIRAWSEAAGAGITPVNPNRHEVDGIPTVSAIAEVEGDVDLAVILTGDAVRVLREVLETKPAFAVIFSAGFAESGTEGERQQTELERLIASTDTRVLGPNTNLNAFELFDDQPGATSTVALVTQSGHQGRPLFQAQRLGLPLSYWAPTGNEADLEFADFARWFADQNEVGVVAAYIEGFKDGRTLQLAADHCARAEVPIVMVKVGRSEAGRSMAKSHTGHLTGSDRVTEAVLGQFGITRVDGLDELQDVAMMLVRSAPPTASGICVYSISGGTGAHMADLCAAAGLNLPQLGNETQEQLRTWIPEYLRVSNPVDCGGVPAMDERGRLILDAIGADAGIGAIVCPITGTLPAMSAMLADDLVHLAATTDKPVCVVWGSPLTDDAAFETLARSPDVVLFRTFQNCARTVKAWLDWHEFAGRYVSPFARTAVSAPAPVDAPEFSGELSEVASKAFLVSHGIPATRERLCKSANDAAAVAAELGYPVVAKVSSPDITHKSDLGLVRLGLGSSDDVCSAHDELLASARRSVPDARLDGVLISEQIDGGVETIVGVTRDELFGPVVMFGIGGMFTEVFDEVAVRVPPFDRDEARRMVDETRASELLSGTRGRPAGDVDALLDVLLTIQDIAVSHADRLVELDINPLVVLPDRVVALDALIVANST